MEEDDEYFNEALLIPDRPLSILPNLAVAISLDEAIVYQQFYWLYRNRRNGKEINGDRWLFNSYEGWRDRYFRFWSVGTVQRIFQTLEKMGILISCQPEGGISRRKYYRPSRAFLEKFKKGMLIDPNKKSKKMKRSDRIKLLSSIEANCSLHNGRNLRSWNDANCAVPIHTEIPYIDDTENTYKEGNSIFTPDFESQIEELAKKLSPNEPEIHDDEW